MQEAFVHLYTRIKEVPILEDPTPHFFVENVFPDDFYQELLSQLPDLNFYQTISSAKKAKGESYDKRFILLLKEEEMSSLPFTSFTFWKTMQLWLCSPEWKSMLVEKFSSQLKMRYQEDVRQKSFFSIAELLRDFQHYSIGPHTDHPMRAITLLFYFPKDSSKSHLGTSFYKHLDPNFSCDGKKHHDFAQFSKVKTIPYLPNSVLGFVRTDKSFHGVEKLQEEDFERNLMNFYLRTEN